MSAEVLERLVAEVVALRRRVAALEHQEWAGLPDGACLEEILDDDGAGSGLDADLLDGKHASAFVTGQGAGVRRTTAQSIPNASWTPIAFDTADWDSDGCWSPSEPTRLYCRTAGIYVISAAVRWVANSNGVRVAYLRYNGVPVRGAVVPDPSPTYVTRQDINDVRSMSPGDFIEVGVYQNSGANLNIEPYERDLVLAMARIG